MTAPAPALTPVDRLAVSLDFGRDQGRAMGRLGPDPERRSAAFEWDPAFLADPLPVWPYPAPRPGPLLRAAPGAGGRLPGLFADSLPDGWTRLVMERELSARGIGPESAGDLDRLAMVGRHGMGALSYRPEAARPGDADPDLDWFEALIPRIEEGAGAEDLMRLRAVAGGSQGARPKFVAQLGPGAALRDHRRGHEPGWRAVLVKARGSADPAGAVEAELAYADLARAAGIDMRPCFALQAASGARFFATERFDRDGAARIHALSFAGFLDVEYREAAADYLDLMKTIRVFVRDMRDLEEMFRRMVFNIRALNRDDHLRNHALLMGPQGRWRLAPAYDLSFSEGPGGEHSLTVAGEGRRPGAAAIAAAGKAMGLKAARIAQIVEAVDAALADWPEAAARHEVPPALARRIGEAMARARAWD